MQGVTLNKRGNVTNRHGQIEHLDTLVRFQMLAALRKQASIRIVHYTIEGDPIYYDLFSKKDRIEMRYDTSKDTFGNRGVTTYSCENLSRDETEIPKLSHHKDNYKSPFVGGVMTVHRRSGDRRFFMFL
jgi:hypothetical protein